jgi:hypothetical protein
MNGAFRRRIIRSRSWQKAVGDDGRDRHGELSPAVPLAPSTRRGAERAAPLAGEGVPMKHVDKQVAL